MTSSSCSYRQHLKGICSMNIKKCNFHKEPLAMFMQQRKGLMLQESLKKQISSPGWTRIKNIYVQGAAYGKSLFTMILKQPGHMYVLCMYHLKYSMNPRMQIMSSIRNVYGKYFRRNNVLHVVTLFFWTAAFSPSPPHIRSPSHQFNTFPP